VETLGDLKVGASLRGHSADGQVRLVQVEWHDNQAVAVTFRDTTGAVKRRLVYRADEPTLEAASSGRPWSLEERLEYRFAEERLQMLGTETRIAHPLLIREFVLRDLDQASNDSTIGSQPADDNRALAGLRKDNAFPAPVKSRLSQLIEPWHQDPFARRLQSHAALEDEVSR
jgi:hypothetical protein